MEERTKQRLVGVLVFVGALFIILPFLFHNARPLGSNNNASGNTSSVAVALPPQNQTQPQTVAMNNDTGMQQAAPASTQTAPANPNQPAADNATTSMPAQNNMPANDNPTNNNPTAAPGQNPTVMPSIAPNNTNNPPAEPAATPNTNQGIPAAATPNNNPAVAPIPVQNNAAQPANNHSPATEQNGLTGQPQQQPAPMPATPNDTAGQNNATTSTAQTSPKKPAHPVMTAEHERHVAVAEGWTIQIGAFSEKANATHLIADLREHHFHVYTRELRSGDHQLTAVFVGPERSLDHVRMAQEQLRSEFRIHGEIKRYEG